MDRRRVRDVLPRFLNAVTGMAVAQGAIHARVAAVTSDVIVFGVSDFPDELQGKYQELRALLGSCSVPQHSIGHPDYRKQVASYYLSPPKARRAANLMKEILEALVYGLNDV